MNKYLHSVGSQIAVVVGLALQLGLTGCATEDGDAPAGEAPTRAAPGADFNESMKQYLVADVQLNSYSVSFYEPEPGLLLEFETGDARGLHIKEPPGLDSVQRFEFLSQAKAPAALVAAQRRAGGEGHEGEAIIAREGTSQIVDEKGVGWGDEAWFRQTYCVQTDRFVGTPPGVWDYHEINWRKQVEYLRGGVFAADGDNISYRMGYSGGNIPDQWYGLWQGQYAAWRNTSSIDRQASSHVIPYGSGYVHCINYHF